jgi:hypothetical protein
MLLWAVPRMLARHLWRIAGQDTGQDKGTSSRITKAFYN